MRTVTWTNEKKEKAIELLTAYFKEHGIGESIMQSDEAIIQAPEMLADIADDILGEDGIKYTYTED